MSILVNFSAIINKYVRKQFYIKFVWPYFLLINGFDERDLCSTMQNEAKIKAIIPSKKHLWIK